MRRNARRTTRGVHAANLQKLPREGRGWRKGLPPQPLYLPCAAQSRLLVSRQHVPLWLLPLGSLGPSAPQYHRRSARLVLLPAYIARYAYGTRYKAGTSGVILPQVFVAAVGGTRDGGLYNWGRGRHCPAYVSILRSMPRHINPPVLPPATVYSTVQFCSRPLPLRPTHLHPAV